MSNYQDITTLIKNVSGSSQWVTGVCIKLTGNLTLGVFLDRLIYWSDKGDNRNKGYFFKSAKQWQAEIGFSYSQVTRSATRLKKMGLIKTKKRKAGIAPMIHYWVNLPLVREALTELLEKERAEKEAEREAEEGSQPNDYAKLELVEIRESSISDNVNSDIKQTEKTMVIQESRDSYTNLSTNTSKEKKDSKKDDLDSFFGPPQPHDQEPRTTDSHQTHIDNTLSQPNGKLDPVEEVAKHLRWCVMGYDGSSLPASKAGKKRWLTPSRNMLEEARGDYLTLIKAIDIFSETEYPEGTNGHWVKNHTLEPFSEKFQFAILDEFKKLKKPPKMSEVAQASQVAQAMAIIPPRDDAPLDPFLEKWEKGKMELSWSIQPRSAMDLINRVEPVEENGHIKLLCPNSQIVGNLKHPNLYPQLVKQFGELEFAVSGSGT